MIQSLLLFVKPKLKIIHLIATGTLLITTALFFGLWRYETLDHKQTDEKLTAAEAAIEKHEDNILLVERANHDYQNNIDRLNADIKRLRSRPARCVTVTSPSGVHSEQGSGREHGGENGVRSDWLYDFAIEAEQIRIERNACKAFVNEVWESRR